MFFFFGFQPDQKAIGLKEELNMIIPSIEEMRKKRSERKKQFVEVLDQICDISSEIYGSAENSLSQRTVDENDLSLRRLEELQPQLLALQKEKVHSLGFFDVIGDFTWKDKEQENKVCLSASANNLKLTSPIALSYLRSISQL